jgi:hypothetical protein
LYYFTTYFDKNYLSRGLVLYESLQLNTSEFILYVLCLDEVTLNFFKDHVDSYPKVKCLTLLELENVDTDLKSCKNTRSLIEYYFTISPCLPLYILRKYNIPHICSLDADILFLSDPTKLFDHLNFASVIITPHKFSAELSQNAKFGIFNVSFQIFKNDAVGLTCLNKWREQCITWCGDYIDETTGFFADQKYLDSWPVEYGNKLIVLNDEVSGLAPWNLNNYKLRFRNDKLYSVNEPVIFYHFHGFKIFSHKWASNWFNPYLVKTYKAIHSLYLNYWNKVSDMDLKWNFTSSASVRYDLSMNLIDKILNEDGVYYRINRTNLKKMNFFNINKRFKWVIIKFYGLLNKA